MLTEYHNLLVSGVIRILIGCAVLFGLVPRLLLPSIFADQPWRRRAAGFLIAGTLVVVTAHLLVLATMYDGVALATVCLGMLVVRVWYSVSRRSVHGFESLFSNLLRMLDVVSWTYCKEWGRRWFKSVGERIDAFHVLSVVVLAAVIAATGLIRLVPVWSHAAPFSIEYYETLEQVKRLQINQMYGGGYRVPLGLAMLAQTLSFLSQVNIAIVLHFLGAVSSMMLAGSIAYVVYRATSSLQGSIIGAALFGLSSNFLPMDLRHQVEADSLVLASAFLLPSLSLFAEYCVEPQLRTLAAAIAGLFCALTISLFVGTFALVGVFIILIGALFFAYRLPWLRGTRLLAMIGVAVALLIGGALFVRALQGYEGFKNTVQVLMYDQHVNRYFSLYEGLPHLFVLMSAVLFGVTMLLSVCRFSEKSLHLQLFSWGALGIALLLLAQYLPEEWAAAVPFSQICFLLSVVTAITFGITVGWGIRFGNEALGHLRARGWMRDSWRLLVLGAALCCLWLYSPAQRVTFEYTAEPDGFAKSLYLIEQKYMPYQWTVVSHRGTALSGMNRGRFLDYGYFYSSFDPETYKHGTKGAVPTPLLFIFVERTHEKSNIATELATVNIGSAANIKHWLDTYQKNHYDLKVFYSDEEVIVYKLEDMTVNALRG